jgi:hypothetical protein
MRIVRQREKEIGAVAQGVTIFLFCAASFLFP